VLCNLSLGFLFTPQDRCRRALRTPLCPQPTLPVHDGWTHPRRRFADRTVMGAPPAEHTQKGYAFFALGQATSSKSSWQKRTYAGGVFYNVERTRSCASQPRRRGGGGRLTDESARPLGRRRRQEKHRVGDARVRDHRLRRGEK
jgi:hypothetical protein